MPLDALVTSVVEFVAAADDLEALGVNAPRPTLIATAERELAQPSLAPTSELRAWTDQLAGRRRDVEERDELPELAIPQRLLHLIPPRRPLPEMIELAAADDALLCERNAARQGFTLHAWALRAVLREQLNA